MEETMLKFLQQMYDIVAATNASFYQINISKVAGSVGLKSVPTQEVLYNNFPSNYPTMDDAIVICKAVRESKRKPSVSQKSIKENNADKKKLNNEIAELTTHRDELKQEVEDMERRVRNYIRMEHELKDIYAAASDFAKLLLDIKNKYNTI